MSESLGGEIPREYACLEQVWIGLRREADGYTAYHDSLLELGDAIIHLAEARLPERVTNVIEAVDSIKAIAGSALLLADELRQSSEELRDVIEKCKDLQHIRREYQKCKLEYESSHRLYKETLEHNSESPDLSSQKDKVQVSLDQLKTKVSDYIKATENFNLFREQKCGSTLGRYLYAVQAFHALENEALSRIKEVTNQLGALKSSLNPKVARYWEEFNEFKAAAMHPEPHIVFGRFTL